MLERAIAPYLDKFAITVILLEEHLNSFPKEHEFLSKFRNVDFIILKETTNGPAETIVEAIKRKSFNMTSQLFVKDCDSFFDFDIPKSGNFVCTSNIADHEVLKKLGSKSFVIKNEQNIITDIIEKKVVSDTFCVGGYGFESVKSYCDSFEKITEESREIYVSDVIAHQYELS